MKKLFLLCLLFAFPASAQAQLTELSRTHLHPTQPQLLHNRAGNCDLVTYQGADPAAGAAEVSDTVPAGAVWKIWSIRAPTSVSDTEQNPEVTIETAGGVEVFLSKAQGAGGGGGFVFGPFGNRDSPTSHWLLTGAPMMAGPGSVITALWEAPGNLNMGAPIYVVEECPAG